jgi:uncharacterized protein with GYD domain
VIFVEVMESIVMEKNEVGIKTVKQPDKVYTQGKGLTAEHGIRRKHMLSTMRKYFYYAKHPFVE